MTSNRLALFLIGWLLFALVIVVELGMGSSMSSGGSGALADAATPGIGIRYLIVVDAALFYTLLLMALEFVAPRAIMSRVQGIITLILSILGILAAIILIYIALTLLMLMITLLLAPPFGTLAYFAAWASFPSGTARATLGLLMFMKILGFVMIVLANPGFLKNKGLMVLMAFSIGATFLTGFLIAFVPSFLAAITDTLGAIIAAVLGAIWLIVMIFSAISSVIKAVRSIIPG